MQINRDPRIWMPRSCIALTINIWYPSVVCAWALITGTSKYLFSIYYSNDLFSMVIFIFTSVEKKWMFFLDVFQFQTQCKWVLDKYWFGIWIRKLVTHMFLGITLLRWDYSMRTSISMTARKNVENKLRIRIQRSLQLKKNTKSGSIFTVRKYQTKFVLVFIHQFTTADLE